MNIKTENISFNIKSKEILKKVSIEINDKKLIGIIGSNGSGKSTFLKCIYGIFKNYKGNIYLNDINIKEISLKERSKKIGVVSQHNKFDFDFSVEDIVLMGRTPHKKFMETTTREDVDFLDSALKKVDIYDLKKRNFLSLSGGEQQRVILARAIVQNTNCLILDEPTNHLDIKYQLRLLETVKSLNLTTIIALHDLNLTLMFCEFVYVLKEGEVIAYGKTKEVLTTDLIKKAYDIDVKIYVDEKNNHHILYN